MIRKLSLVLALGMMVNGCQKPCGTNSPTERVILKAPSFDHPLLMKQRELIEHNRSVLNSKGIQVYIEIVNPNMFALREMPDSSFQVQLFAKDGSLKGCYKGHVVSIASLINSPSTNSRPQTKP